MLKVVTFIYRHLQGNSDQQRFTMRSGILTGNDTSWRSASSGYPLPEWTDFGPRSLQLDRPNSASASRTMAFTPQCSPVVLNPVTFFLSRHIFAVYSFRYFVSMSPFSVIKISSLNVGSAVTYVWTHTFTQVTLTHPYRYIFIQSWLLPNKSPICRNFPVIVLYFYRAMHYVHSAVLRLHGVCPSVCLWRWWIVIT